LDVIKWAQKCVELGAGEILLTSMDKDGTKDGYDLELMEQVTKEVDVPVIASGGAGKKEHFVDVCKKGASAVLAASLFHFKQLEISDLKQYMKQNGIEVR
jgi:cyclase